MASEKLNVVLVGGGNSTHVLAGLASNAGHTVSILTRRPADWASDKVVTCENQDPGWAQDAEVSGTVAEFSNDTERLVGGADIVVLAGLPVHLYRTVLKSLAPFVKPGQLLGSLCAYGGFSWLVKEALGEELAAQVCAFGTQSIPWTCGTLQYGSRGVVFGAKRHLHIAFDNIDVCGPRVGPDPLAAIGTLLRIDKVEATDFLTCTMWPNNPLFHPTVLWGLFEDWDMKASFKVEDLPVRIYGDVTRKSAAAIQSMDDEMQLIVQALRLKVPDNRYLDMAKPLKECLLFHYKELITDPTDMYSILRSNVAYSKHKITYKVVGEGLIMPDVEHKFFTTDLPYGLVIYKDIALSLGVETPMIDTLIMWNQRMVSKEFMVDGKLCGKDIDEAVVPSRFGGVF